MNVSEQDQEFRAAIESLETCLMTPRVPGDLERWVAAIETAIEAVGMVIRRQIDHEHRSQFQQITSEDPELHARVERLKVGDEQSREQFDSLRDRLQRLKKSVPGIEPDEGRLEPAMAGFCTDGLSFVMHLRQQEVAIDTWLQEAFNRDRGVGD